mmetsp:Transcript_6162/g.12812  ORF Transcript_6162/g.12812 Transcript_6162/m.12812 type:complete len:158 (+) Transcript_6162:169-642(+)
MSSLSSPTKLTAAQHAAFLQALEEATSRPSSDGDGVEALKNIAAKLNLPSEAVQVHAYKYFLKLQGSAMDTHGALLPSPSLNLDLSSGAGAETSVQPRWTQEEDTKMERLLVVHPASEEGTRWINIGEEMGKPPEEVKAKYEQLLQDVFRIEVGMNL